MLYYRIYNMHEFDIHLEALLKAGQTDPTGWDRLYTALHLLSLIGDGTHVDNQARKFITRKHLELPENSPVRSMFEYGFALGYYRAEIVDLFEHNETAKSSVVRNREAVISLGEEYAGRLLQSYEQNPVAQNQLFELFVIAAQIGVLMATHKDRMPWFDDYELYQPHVSRVHTILSGIE